MDSQNPTFSIDFFTRNSKKDKGQAFIYARITVEGKVKEISLRQSIPKGKWDHRCGGKRPGYFAWAKPELDQETGGVFCGISHQFFDRHYLVFEEMPGRQVLYPAPCH